MIVTVALLLKRLLYLKTLTMCNKYDNIFKYVFG